MIRPLTCICMLLASGSGLYLYQAKHQAQMLDREIVRTSKATDAARERIGVLRGEWALLNEPDRLAALSQEHLGLKTLTPTQFVTAAELATRLPPPVLPGAAPEPAGEDAPVPTATALPAPPPPVAPTPAPAAPARTVIAAKQPLPTPGQPAPARPPVQVASALPVPAVPLPAPRPSPPRPVFAPLVNVSASPTAPAPSAPRPPQARAASPSSAAPPRPAAPDGDLAVRVAQHIPGPGIAAPVAPGYGPPPAVPVSASVLGGARPLLPPPVPYGSAMAASGASAR